VPRLSNRNAYAILEKNGEKSFEVRSHPHLRSILETIPENRLPAETQRDVRRMLEVAEYLDNLAV